jgi:hypothetical protein
MKPFLTRTMHGELAQNELREWLHLGRAPRGTLAPKIQVPAPPTGLAALDQVRIEKFALIGAN